MAQTKKLRKYKSLFSTTLSSGIGTGTSDTITLASAAGLPTDTEVTLTFDRVDSNGTATPAKLERITGTISGSTLTSYTRGIDGTTEQAHGGGAVVEMVWNADDWNDVIDQILVEHNDAGTHKAALVTTLKATGAEVNTGTEDAKIVTPKALADSNFKQNPMTAAGDIIYGGASGAPTRLAKGTAAQVLTMNAGATAPEWADQTVASSDGWTADTDTWVYVGANSFKITGKDVTARFPVGTKIKLTQTTAKYFYVGACAMSGSDTLVTIYAGTDYTLANAAITSPNYSYYERPQAFPDIFNVGNITWDTATIDNGTGGQQPGTGYSRFRMNGRMVIYTFGVATTNVLKAGAGIAIGFTIPTTMPPLSATYHSQQYTHLGSFNAVGVNRPAVITTSAAITGATIIFDTAAGTIADNANISLSSGTIQFYA